MYQNQILLKGGDASRVVDEIADTRLVLMDGLVVKSHRLILASNAFLHQVLLLYVFHQVVLLCESNIARMTIIE